MLDRLEPTQHPGVSASAHALSALAAAIALGLALSAPAQAVEPPNNVPEPEQAVTIEALSISGNSTFSSSQLQGAMGINAAGLFSPGDDYSRALLASALSNLRSFYISRGYLRFKVKDVKTVPAPDGKTVAISITVSEGRLYTLASIKLTGDAGNLADTPGVTQALQRALPIGQPITRNGLEVARRAIIAQLGHDGYAQPGVSPGFITDDKNARITLTFEITHSQSLAQTSPVPPSTVTPTAPLPSQPQTAPVKPSQTQPAPAESASGSSQQAEQKLDLTEPREITLGASIGYSSTDRLIAIANARFRNALGKDHDLAATVAAGSTSRAASLTESDRWYTPSGVSRSTTLWYRADQPFYYLNQSHFRTSGTGLTERFDIPLTAADNVSIAPGVEHDWLGLDGLTPLAYLNYVNRNGPTLNVATLTGGWTHDMRDSASLPTQGYITQANAELGLGNAYYLKTYASARYYHPLWGDTVLSLSGVGGFGQGLGSKGYPIEKYFYAGGIGSVRGYAANSLGSHDIATGYPVGGRRLLVGSVEADTPLMPFKSDLPGRLVWMLFVDGGNVWDSGLGGTAAGTTRFSYGTGLGWQIPFGTLKLSLAMPIARHAGDDYQKFQVEFNAGF